MRVFTMYSNKVRGNLFQCPQDVFGNKVKDQQFLKTSADFGSCIREGKSEQQRVALLLAENMGHRWIEGGGTREGQEKNVYLTFPSSLIRKS